MSLIGPLQLVTPATGLPVTVEEARSYCRIDQLAEAPLIRQLIVDATRFVERTINGGRQIMPATYDAPIRGWWCGSLTMPRPPLQSVESITYRDSAGATQTLDPSVYEVRTYESQPGTIALAFNQFWPGSLAPVEFPIAIQFVAGYADAASVPGTLKRAIHLLVAHWFENREPVITGTISSSLPLGIADLLACEEWGSYA